MSQASTSKYHPGLGNLRNHRHLYTRSPEENCTEVAVGIAMLPANCFAEWTKWHRGHENWKWLKVGHVKQIPNTYSTNAKSCLRSKGKASNYTQYPAKLHIPPIQTIVTIHISKGDIISPRENSTISAPSHMDSRRTGSTIGTAVSGLGQREDLEEMLSWAARWLPADFRRQWCGWDQMKFCV